MPVRIELIDSILKYLYENGTYYSPDELRQKLGDESLLLNDISIAINKLMKDGNIMNVMVQQHPIMKELGEDDYIAYSITYDGIIFYELGGYKEFARREKQEREFTEKKMRLELKQIRSSIRTNNSVISVNRLFWAVLALTAINAIGTGGTFILELRKKEQTSSKESRSLLIDTARRVQNSPKIDSGRRKKN